MPSQEKNSMMQNLSQDQEKQNPIQARSIGQILRFELGPIEADMRRAEQQAQPAEEQQEPFLAPEEPKAEEDTKDISRKTGAKKKKADILPILPHLNF